MKAQKGKRAAPHFSVHGLGGLLLAGAGAVGEPQPLGDLEHHVALLAVDVLRTEMTLSVNCLSSKCLWVSRLLYPISMFCPSKSSLWTLPPILELASSTVTFVIPALIGRHCKLAKKREIRIPPSAHLNSLDAAERPAAPAPTTTTEGPSPAPFPMLRAEITRKCE